jgi:hypothetical protein
MVVNCVTIAVTTSTFVEFERDEFNGTGYDGLRRPEAVVRK